MTLLTSGGCYIQKRLPSLFIYHTHDDFDSADPSRMQDACHTGTQLNDQVALHEFWQLSG